MFALMKNGHAKCLQTYKDIQEGATVPPVNELWQKVQEWSDANGGLNDYVAPPPEPPTLDQVYALRAAAYANPQTGSDRHFLEAARKRADGDTTGADAATAAGLARVADIKAEYPLP